jgi:hypothetical protein
MEHENLGIDANGEATSGLNQEGESTEWHEPDESRGSSPEFCEGLGVEFPGPTRPLSREEDERVVCNRRRLLRGPYRLPLGYTALESKTACVKFDANVTCRELPAVGD